MPRLSKPEDPVREVVKRHLTAALTELGLRAELSNADVNPMHLIRIERLLVDVATHFIYDLKRLMKK
jgi:hypothetical protein